MTGHLFPLSPLCLLIEFTSNVVMLAETKTIHGLHDMNLTRIKATWQLKNEVVKKKTRAASCGDRSLDAWNSRSSYTWSPDFSVIGANKLSFQISLVELVFQHVLPKVFLYTSHDDELPYSANLGNRGTTKMLLSFTFQRDTIDIFLSLSGTISRCLCWPSPKLWGFLK